MKISLYVDETGTITNAYEPNHFGLGFVICKTDQIQTVEQKLKTANLDKIHMRKERDPISLAERINSLSLDNDEISGGAIIQKDPSFALMAARHVANQMAIHMPDVVIAAINSNKQVKQIKDKIIYSLEDFLPKQFRDIRTGEFAIHATRLTLLRVLHAFGHNSPLEIIVNFSAVGDKEKYKKALGVFSKDFEQSLFSFFSDLFEVKRFPRNPCEYVTVRFEVDSRNDGLYGLADFFAYIGHKTAKCDSIADGLYNSTAPLFAIGPAHKWEIKKGIFLIT